MEGRRGEREEGRGREGGGGRRRGGGGEGGRLGGGEVEEGGEGEDGRGGIRMNHGAVAWEALHFVTGQWGKYVGSINTARTSGDEICWRESLSLSVLGPSESRFLICTPKQSLNPDPANTNPPTLGCELRFADAGFGPHLIPNARVAEFGLSIVE